MLEIIKDTVAEVERDRSEGRLSHWGQAQTLIEAHQPHDSFREGDECREVEIEEQSDQEADESEPGEENVEDGIENADIAMDALKDAQSDAEVVVHPCHQETDETESPEQLALQELSPQASDTAIDCLRKCIAIAHAGSQKDLLGDLQKRLAAAIKHQTIASSELTLHLRTLSLKRRQEDDEERKRKRGEELKLEKDVAKSQAQAMEAKHLAAKVRLEELKARSTEREELLRLEQEKKLELAEQQKLQQHGAALVAKYILRWWRTRSPADQAAVMAKVQRARDHGRGSAFCEVPEFFSPLSRMALLLT